jgi:hypothetical protein
MEKKVFVETIKAIRKQIELDNKVSTCLGKVFPDVFAPLLPDNHFLQDALIKLLEIEMNDLTDSWIKYFLWELDFGKENYRLKVTQDGKEIKKGSAGELYELLINNKKS